MLNRSKKRANGEGSLYQKPNKTWCLQITIGTKPDGSPLRKSFSGKTRAEVKAKRDAFEQSRQKEEQQSLILSKKCPTFTGDLTLVNWINHYLQLYKKPPLTKETTFASYLYNFEMHIKPYFKDILLSDVNEAVIQSFYTYKSQGGRLDGKDGGLSPKSIYNLHIILHAALGKAVRLKLIDEDPTLDTVRPKVKTPEMRVLDLGEMQIFMSELVKETQRAAMLTDLFTGLRLGELLALRIEDLDLERQGLHVRRNVVRFKTYDDAPGVPKTKLMIQDTLKSGRDELFVPLMDDLFDILHRHVVLLEYSNWPNPDGLLFPSTKGTILDPRSFQKRVQAVSKRCEIRNVNVHALRHTFATRLVEQNVPLAVVRELLGHSSIQTTQRYAHVLDMPRKNAVNGLSDFMLENSDIFRKFVKPVTYSLPAGCSTVATEP